MIGGYVSLTKLFTLSRPLAHLKSIVRWAGQTQAIMLHIIPLGNVRLYIQSINVHFIYLFIHFINISIFLASPKRKEHIVLPALM